MRLVTIVLLGCSLTVACMGGGGRRPSVSGRAPAATSPAAQLQGQWELVTIDAQGEPRQAQGRLSFDQNNNIAVRAELAPGEAGAAPPRVVLLDFSARASVSANELTYIGVETRAPDEQMIPSATAPSAWRFFSVEGDTLRVWQTDADGRTVGTMIFRRAG